ncbi:hypothetical protein R1sor_016750 [Riccia sorocarpa]|uniref:RRM domain-containing protein n=1 Tax=Riccia sorocarpa TaxID=122646 RepID=A0ABD3HHX1_9MARC
MSYVFQGEVAVGSFRSWVQTNRVRKLEVQIESIQETGERAFLTTFRTREERDWIVKQPHVPLRGCLVGHFPWSIEMEDENYAPRKKPTQIEICGVPKWAKEDLPRIFSKIGQVLFIPPESRDLIYRNAKATILWEAEQQLPSFITVSVMEHRVRCQVRKLEDRIWRFEESVQVETSHVQSRPNGVLRRELEDTGTQGDGGRQVQKVIHHAQFWTSDHLPVSAELLGEDRETRRPEVFNSAYFKADHKVVEKNLHRLRHVWEDVTEDTQRSALERFVLGWASVRRELKNVQYQKARQLRQLPEKENRLQALAKKDPARMTVEEKGEMGILISEVRELQAWRNHRWRLTSRENHLKDGEANSAYFFRRFKARRSRMKIEKIRREDGSWTQNLEEVKTEVLNGFTRLYKKDEDTKEARAARRSLTDTISKKLTAEQRVLLDEQPSKGELAGALALLPNGKSPGTMDVVRKV